MKKGLTFSMVLAYIALVSLGAHAQSLQSVAAVNATNYPTLCQDIENSGTGVTRH